MLTSRWKWGNQSVIAGTFAETKESKVRGTVEVTLRPIRNISLVHLKEYIKHAKIIAEGMKKEYDKLELHGKTVEEIFKNKATLGQLRQCSYTPYLINMIIEIAKSNQKSTFTFFKLFLLAC